MACTSKSTRDGDEHGVEKMRKAGSYLRKQGKKSALSGGLMCREQSLRGGDVGVWIYKS